MEGVTVQNFERTSSKQASVRGSFRSDGSGQSQVRRPFSQLSFIEPQVPSEFDHMPSPLARCNWDTSLVSTRPQTLLQYQPQISTIYHGVFQANSPAMGSIDWQTTLPSRFDTYSFNENESMVELARHSAKSSINELPSLRPIHDLTTSNYRIIGQPGSFHRAGLEQSPLRATVPIGRSISQFAGRVLTKKLKTLETVPEAIYDSTSGHQPSQPAQVNRNKQYYHYQNLSIPQHLVGQPQSRERMDTLNTSTDSSSEKQFEYTRDHLLGAVEKVRSGYLMNRSSPYRPSIEGWHTPVRTPVLTSVDEKSLPHDTVSVVPRKHVFSSYSTVKPSHSFSPSAELNFRRGGEKVNRDYVLEQNATYHRDDSYLHEIPSTTSQTSLNLTSPHQQFIQLTSSSSTAQFGEPFRINPGFANPLSLSAHNSNSPGQSSGISAEGSTSLVHPSRIVVLPRASLSGASPSSFPTPPPQALIESYPMHSQAQTLSYARETLPADLSVDENYEFDATSPSDVELVERLRREQLRWRHWQTWQRERNLSAHQQRLPHELPTHLMSNRGPLSDTEIYGTLGSRSARFQSFRVPRTNITVEDMEARCAALREEFIKFRQQQAQLQHNVSQYYPNATNSTSSSDEFESMC